MRKPSQLSAASPRDQSGVPKCSSARRGFATNFFRKLHVNPLQSLKTRLDKAPFSGAERVLNGALGAAERAPNRAEASQRGAGRYAIHSPPS